MVRHCEHGTAWRDMLLTFNVGAAGELVQYVAPSSREPVLANEIVEAQNLTRKPSRGKARQPIHQGLEAPQAIELECCQDLSSIGPCKQGQIVDHQDRAPSCKSLKRRFWLIDQGRIQVSRFGQVGEMERGLNRASAIRRRLQRSHENVRSPTRAAKPKPKHGA